MANADLPDLDPSCPEANDFFEAVDREVDAMGLHGLAGHEARLAKVSPFAIAHVESCVRCRRFGNPEREERSAVWGGATLGLFVGLVIGFFRERYWATVFYAVLIGAASGLAANLLSAAARLWARRGTLKG